MRYNELCAISGLSGIFQLLSTKSDGAIVKNLDDGVSKFVPARLHNVTPLDSIEVFTETDNVRLWEVFMSFKKNEAIAGSFDISKADSKAIKTYFGKMFPEFDKDRVYVSDMKKMVKWFTILKKMDLLKEETAEENTTATNTEQAQKETLEIEKTPKPKKTTKAKVEVEATEKPIKPKKAAKTKTSEA
jgi:hypothetical protein